MQAKYMPAYSDRGFTLCLSLRVVKFLDTLRGRQAEFRVFVLIDRNLYHCVLNFTQRNDA